MIRAYDKVYLGKARTALVVCWTLRCMISNSILLNFSICSSSPALRNALKPAISLLLLYVRCGACL